MSADLNTAITVQGTPEELSAILKVLRAYETEKLEQYRAQHNCGYLEDVAASGAGGECSTAELTDDEIEAFAAEAGAEITVDAGGPWGAFNFPGDIGLFEAMADAAPTAAFKGQIDGFITGADVSCRAELRDGLLYISEYAIPDEEIPELYIKDFKKKLPYSKFCKLFKVDKDEFDKDCYEDFILEAGEEGFPDDIEYDTFVDLCYGSEIEEEQFEEAIEKISELALVDFDTFRDSVDRNEYAEKHVYDPKTKAYSKG